jgi:hypothetical protein
LGQHAFEFEAAGAHLLAWLLLPEAQLQAQQCIHAGEAIVCSTRQILLLLLSKQHAEEPMYAADDRADVVRRSRQIRLLLLLVALAEAALVLVELTAAEPPSIVQHGMKLCTAPCYVA